MAERQWWEKGSRQRQRWRLSLMSCWMLCGQVLLASEERLSTNDGREKVETEDYKRRKKKTREWKKRTAVLMPQWHLVLLVCERQWGHVMDGGRQGEARHVVVKPLGWDVGSLSTHRRRLGFYFKAYIQWGKLNPGELFDISGKLQELNLRGWDGDINHECVFHIEWLQPPIYHDLNIQIFRQGFKRKANFPLTFPWMCKNESLK